VFGIVNREKTCMWTR